jgi:hypothetical protein
MIFISVALAGAVLAQHRVDLAGFDAQGHLVVGAHRRVLLADSSKFEARSGGHQGGLMVSVGSAGSPARR